MGIYTFATVGTLHATSVHGNKINAPKPLKNNLKKLAKFQRKFAQTEPGSKLRDKAKLRVAKLHAKIKDIRTDFLHKLSTDLVKQYDTIVLENLNVSGMVRNRKLAKAISDLGWRQFRTCTDVSRNVASAKCEKYGMVEILELFLGGNLPQKCSNCGFKGGKKELNVSLRDIKREWTCLNCGTFHDRDINAAVNILNTQYDTQYVTNLETVNQPITKVETVAENPIQLSLFEIVAPWACLLRRSYANGDYTKTDTELT